MLGEGIPAPEWLAGFEQGVRAYRSGDFPSAREAFAGSLSLHGGDKAAQEYLRRLDSFPAGPPPDWDPAHTMLDK